MQQERMETEHAKLQQAQERHTNASQTIHKQADIKHRDEEINAMIDKKLARFNEKNETRLHNTATKIRKDFDAALDRKIDQMSVTVANQVGLQLLDVFQQILAPSGNSNVNTIKGLHSPSLITQDGHKVFSQGLLEAQENSPEKRLANTICAEIQTQEETYENTSTQNISCSTHDNITEQMTMTE